MRKLVWVLMVLAGCVSSYEHGWHERCANYGMVMDGVSMSAGTTSATATAAGQSGVYVGRATAQDSSESASCRQPGTRQEACELRAWVASAEVKDAWDPGWRNVVIFFGFLAFIAPGALASVYFHRDQDAVELDAKNAWRAAYDRCIAETARPGPPGDQ